MAAKPRRSSNSALNRKTTLSGGWGRKLLLGVLVISVLSVVAISITSWVLHWSMRDRVSQELKTGLEQQLNAQVHFGKVSLSLWAHFPSLSLQVSDLKIIGKGEFSRDTLLQAKQMDLALSLASAWNDEQPRPHALYLDKPNLRLKVLRNGSQNWDIINKKGASNQKGGPLEALDYVEVDAGTFEYEDRQRQLTIGLAKIDAELDAPFSKSVFDAEFEFEGQELTFFDGNIGYLQHGKLKGDINLRADHNNRELRITSSDLLLNALPLSLAGRLTFPSDGAFADINIQAQNDDFKGLLSLLPGIYTENFDDIQTQGTATCNFALRGSLSNGQVPGLQVDIKITDGFFQFPNRPQPVSNVQLSLSMERPANAPDQLTVQMPYFKANLGPNPIDGRLVLSGKNQNHVEAQLMAKVKLETLGAIFPFEQQDVKGILDVQLTAAGDFGDSSLPVVSARTDLRYGFLKSADYPAPLQNLTLAATMENKTGLREDFHLTVSNLHAEIDGEPLDAKLDIKDLKNPIYNLNLIGKLDLGKLARILNLKETRVQGLFDADIQTHGQLGAAYKAEANDGAKQSAKHEAEGGIRLTDFVWQGAGLPGLLQISAMQIVMQPNALKIPTFKGSYASTDLEVNGVLRNPFGYWFQNDTLRGELQLRSQRFNLNEWLADATPEQFQAGGGSSQPLEVLKTPDRVDVLLATACNNVFYEDLILQNLSGGILFKHQTLRFVEVAYQLLGAPFNLQGEYDSRNMAEPRFRFRLMTKGLSLATAHQNFALVRSYAPLCQDLKGTFSGEALIEGILDGALNPRPETLSGTISLTINDLSNAKPLPPLEALSERLKSPQLGSLSAKDLSLEMSFADGRLYVKPFALTFGDVFVMISGSIGAAKDLEYNLMANVSTGAVGSATAQAVASWVGKPIEVTQRLDLPITLRGQYASPELALSETPFVLEGGEAPPPKPADTKPKESILETLQKLEAEKKAQEQAEKLKQELDKKALEEQQRIKEELEKQKKEQEEQLKQQNKKQQKQSGKPLN